MTRINNRTRVVSVDAGENKNQQQPSPPTPPNHAAQAAAITATGAVFAAFGTVLGLLKGTSMFTPCLVAVLVLFVLWLIFLVWPSTRADAAGPSRSRNPWKYSLLIAVVLLPILIIGLVNSDQIKKYFPNISEEAGAQQQVRNYLDLINESLKLTTDQDPDQPYLDQMYRAHSLLSDEKAKKNLVSYAQQLDLDPPLKLDESKTFEMLWNELRDKNKLPAIAHRFREGYGDSRSLEIVGLNIRAVPPSERVLEKRKDVEYEVYVFIEYSGYYLFDNELMDDQKNDNGDVTRAGVNLRTLANIVNGVTEDRKKLSDYLTTRFRNVTPEKLEAIWYTIGDKRLADLKDDDRWDKMLTRESPLCKVNGDKTEKGVQRVMVVYPMSRDRTVSSWLFSTQNPWRIGDSEDCRLLIREKSRTTR